MPAWMRADHERADERAVDAAAAAEHGRAADEHRGQRGQEEARAKGARVEVDDAQAVERAGERSGHADQHEQQ